jgi:hypothetical protein
MLRGNRVKFLPHNILVNSRINILQWILTKLGRESGTLLIFKVTGSNFFRRGDTPRFALPLLFLIQTKFGQNPLKDLDSSI